MFSGFETSAVDVGATTIFHSSQGERQAVAALARLSSDPSDVAPRGTRLGGRICGRLRRSSRVWIERQAPVDAGSRAIFKERDGPRHGSHDGGQRLFTLFRGGA